MARGKKTESLTIEEKIEASLVPEDERPYEVPGNWCWVKFESVKLNSNGFFDGDWILGENMNPEGEVRLLQLSDIGIGEFLNKSNKHITEETFNELKCTALKAGDVIISRMAEPIARSCIVPSFDYKAITAVDVAVLRCNEEIISNKYLNYLCNVKWFTDMALSLARGTTRVRITRAHLGNMPMPLPPLPEQYRIVERIEGLFSQLDEARDKTQEALHSFENRKSAILQAAFSGKLIQAEEKGVIPLSEIAEEIHIGPFGSALHKEDYIADGIPVINPRHIVNQTIVSDTKVTISEDKAKELSSYRVKENDIILGRRGEMGRSAPVQMKHDGWICGTGSMIIRLKKGYDAVFYSQIIASEPSVRYLNENAVGSTMSNLNEKIIKNLPVPNYTIQEQNKMMGILSKLIEEEKVANDLLEQVVGQIDFVKKSIVSQAFRGELGTNDPDEESAKELLKKVL